MTGSTKPGDAKADMLRDEFRRNRALRRAALDSLPDDDANEKPPSASVTSTLMISTPLQ